MTEEKYAKMESLLKSRKTLDRLWSIMCKPCPSIYKNKRILFGHDFWEISFIEFDKTTREELREAIKAVITKRSKEIEKEIEEL